MGRGGGGVIHVHHSMWKHWSVPVCLCDNVQTEKLKRKVVKGAETVEAVRTDLN